MTTKDFYNEIYPIIRTAISKLSGFRKYLIYPILPLVVRITIEVIAVTQAPAWLPVLNYIIAQVFPIVPANIMSDQEKKIIQDLVQLFGTNQYQMHSSVQAALLTDPKNRIVPKDEAWPL